MLNYNLNYDNKYDIMYINLIEEPSYADEIEPNIVITRSINTDEITGAIIIGFKDKLNNGRLYNIHWPFKIDFDSLI